MHWLLWIAALAACGGEPAPPDASFPHDGSPSTFTLTSPVLRDGARFADMNTCAGADTSPQLDWAGAVVRRASVDHRDHRPGAGDVASNSFAVLNGRPGRRPHASKAAAITAA